MIDEKALLSEIAKTCPECYGLVAKAVGKIKPKRGKWINDEETGDLRCSVCGHYTCEIQGYWGDADENMAEALDIPVGTRYHVSETPRYCSRCGAYMRGEDDETD